MQLASSGLRASSHAIGNAGRQMHMSAMISRQATKPGQTNANTVKSIFKQTRTFVTRFIGQLTTPGIGSSGHIFTASRSIHHGHTQTIQQSFSLPMRYALGRPLHLRHLPRPHPVPANITHVGLGTARAFSTGRPIFQSIADNVPIAGRAFWEADWEVKQRQERRKMLAKRRKRQAAKRSSQSKLKAHAKTIIKSDSPLSSTSSEGRAADLEHYLPEAVVPEVVTYLFVPLAPTPTNRLPLSLAPPVHTSMHPLLPFSVLSQVHTNHARHSLRVNTLFARLDVARVFDDKRVESSAYGDRRGLCTILEVRFDGWTEEQVRGVLGEAGSGWCVLEEVWKGQELVEEAVMDDVLSELSMDDHCATHRSTPSPPLSPLPSHSEIDPSSSFVLPNLDFSANFSGTQIPSHIAAMSGTSTPLSNLEFHNNWVASLRERTPSEHSSDFGDEYSRAPSPMSRRSSSGSDSWMAIGFSSEFSGRIIEQNLPPEPRESAFQ